MSDNTITPLSLWLMAIRPKTLPAAVGPILVASAVAIRDEKFQFLAALFCLIGALLLQIAVNLANDYFDGINKIDSEERLGPVRVTQSGLIAPAAVKRAMLICLGLAAVVFVYLAILGGWPIVIVGVASLLGALGYSGGPYPLASNGLGELFVFIFFGLVAVGASYFIQAGELTGLVMLAAVPPGLLITAIMVVNNLRDIDTDKKAGKITLAVMLGRRKTLFEYRLLLMASYLIPYIMFVLGLSGGAVLLPLLSLPLAWRLFRKISLETGQGLNPLLGSTAGLSCIYSLLFSFGLVASM